MEFKSKEEAKKYMDESVARMDKINDTLRRLMDMSPSDRDALMDDKWSVMIMEAKIGDSYRNEDYKHILDLVFRVAGSPNEGFKLIWEGLHFALALKFDDLIYGEDDPNDPYINYQSRKPLPKRYGYRKK